MAHTEPEVFINGQKLNSGQSMTLRVALSSFHSDMAQPGALGGAHVATLYADSARSIEEYMFRNLNGNTPPNGQLSEFKADQWWVQELDKLTKDGTPDQKRAVAVLHSLLEMIAGKR
jgi:hypothetical protein